MQKIYFAPLEGITNHLYRRAHAKYFHGIDRYYTPFIAPNHSHKLTTREMLDVLPENNPGITLIPQILTREPADFLWCTEKLKQLGYTQADLNMGCPSGTVVTKGKGSGMLSDLDALKRFLDAVFRDVSIAVSAKTRIGMTSPEEFTAILAILSQYPFCEITVHPRTRVQQYKGEPLLSAFEEAVGVCPFPVSYNGNLFSEEDVAAFTARYPDVHALMLGRGLIANPGLGDLLARREMPEKAIYKAFADDVLEGYLELWRDPNAVVCHMKEFWSYLIAMFESSDKHAKAIRKSSSVPAYRDAVEKLFNDCEMQKVDSWTFRRL